jgi:hypothetical protein
MAAIHVNEAKNAATKPEKITGSKITKKRNFTLPRKSIGAGSSLAIRHLKIICPNTVNAIVKTMYR